MTTDRSREAKGTRMFYPEVAKAHAKWAKTACDNPIIIADAGFETYLAGWQAGQNAARADMVGALEKRFIKESRPFRGSENSGMMHITNIIAIIRAATGGKDD